MYRGIDKSETERKRLQVRARIVALDEQGVPPSEIAQKVGCSKSTVSKWITRLVFHVFKHLF